ncbi:TetR/AcrR family transcriptional regulator [Helicobacter sp. MIT 14-3879]|uniref:TetR/AcrR family transcriptional regulator n=1 Tax=Helicobacter sp. MIT 14-3879 TaxID=2040649 RepID=UPI0015F1B637|nr:TetR/AcrR family transcriptional regulator [Helicobacter sp. MIT 14-3879]
MALVKDTKEQIIQKTRIYLQNIDCVRTISLDSILEEVGISKGVFYYYFKNKDDLLYQAVIPDIDEREKEINREISKLDTLREKIYLIFGIFVDENMKDKLKSLEEFYIYLFFENNINRKKALKKIYTRINKGRKSIILRQIKFHNIKLTKELTILTNYVMDSIMLYHIFCKRFRDKSTKKEIINFLNVFCDLIETKFEKQDAQKRRQKA